MPTTAVIENIVTLLLTAATVLGLAYFGFGGNSFWALALLINLNSPRSKA